jgi:UDP-2,3-diacylglucosamine pyrophosphatase LpxH
MKVESLENNIHRISHEVASTQTSTYLLLSDVHYDSLHCDRQLLKKHLDQAKEYNAQVLIFGDWFDVMGCYGDPRSKSNEIRQDYMSKDFSYLDMVIEDSIEFLQPYADNILLISEGNHETNIKKRHDTDPLKRLLDGLHAYNPNICRGRYTGWVLFENKYKKGSHNRTFKLHYHHGFGGNAKRSKGMLDVQLEAMRYPDADILCRGHDHQKWHDPSTTRVRLSHRYAQYKDSVHYIKTGSYKDGFDKGEGGFEVEKNFMPTKLGGWWLHLQFERKKGSTIKVTEAE